MVSHIDCIIDFIHYRSNFMATKTLLSSIHYGAVATYAPIKGLKNHLTIFALLGNIQASNLTQFVADEDLRGRNVLLLTSFLLRELLHMLTSLCFQDARRRSQHRCRHFVWRSQQCCRHVMRRSQKRCPRLFQQWAQTDMAVVRSVRLVVLHTPQT